MTGAPLRPFARSKADYTHWKTLRADPRRYRAEKERLADQIVAALDRRFPGLAVAVDMRDVATPVTYERFTGNWEGCIEGWLATPKLANQHVSKTLPGLGDFYMAGHWVEPGGGVPPAALSGRNVVQLICHKDRETFLATTP